MKNLLNDLYHKFVDKGFLPVEINDLIRDIVTYFQNNRECSLAHLNLELESLGWGFYLLDEALFRKVITHVKQSMVADSDDLFLKGIVSGEINVHQQISLSG